MAALPEGADEALPKLLGMRRFGFAFLEEDWGHSDGLDEEEPTPLAGSRYNEIDTATLGVEGPRENAILYIIRFDLVSDGSAGLEDHDVACLIEHKNRRLQCLAQDRDLQLALARTVEFGEIDSLPAAECELSIPHRDRLGRSNQR